MPVVHIVPSGATYNKSLCGQINPKYFTSTGLGSTCDDCYKIAKQIMEKYQR